MGNCGIIYSMIKVGDRVKIVRVHPPKLFTSGSFTWALGVEGTIEDISDALDLEQPYYVKFDAYQYSWKGLWCHEVEYLSEVVVLPKELFEI